MHHRSCTTSVRFFSTRLIYTFLRFLFFAPRERKTARYTSFCPFASRKNITSAQRENTSRTSNPSWTKTLVKQLRKNYCLFSLVWKNFPIASVFISLGKLQLLHQDWHNSFFVSPQFLSTRLQSELERTLGEKAIFNKFNKYIPSFLLLLLVW